MRGTLPPNPTGFDEESIFHQTIRERVVGAPSKFNDSKTVVVNRTTKGVSFRAKVPNTVKGWFWVKGQRRFEDTGACVMNQVVYVAPDDTFVTDGVDIDGLQCYATPGVYVATQASPATPTKQAHLPGDPNGQPDDKDVYWWPIFQKAMRLRGLYAQGVSYMYQDVVKREGTTSDGTFCSTIDNNLNDPNTGIGWTQISGSRIVGKWA